MGMALDESTDEMQKLESNGIEAFIDPRVAESIKSLGDINIDFVNGPQGSGYTIKVGDPSCSPDSCSGCG